MVISHSHSQPLLRHHTDDHNDGAPTTRSYNDMTIDCIRRGGVDAYLRRCQTASGYVSLEDVVNSKEFREGVVRRPEAAGIRDPFVRTTAYSRAHPRHRRRSPGPMGTRRGGAMHRFVKKYVAPCLTLVARTFCCCMPGAAKH